MSGREGTFAHVEPRRRCALCRMPSNRCPCKHCGACSTSGSHAGACGCGRQDDPAGGGERSPRGGSPVGLNTGGAA